MYQNFNIKSNKRAKIKKRIYPHLFRHSRSTILARHLTESEMKNVLGWDAGSSMPSIYVHLSSRDSDSAIFKMHGIKTNQESGEIQKEKLCLRCKRMNRPGARLCDTCGFILDKEEAEIILQEEKDRNKADEIMNKLMKDPEIYALIKQKLS